MRGRLSPPVVKDSTWTVSPFDYSLNGGPLALLKKKKNQVHEPLEMASTLGSQDVS